MYLSQLWYKVYSGFIEQGQNTTLFEQRSSFFFRECFFGSDILTVLLRKPNLSSPSLGNLFSLHILATNEIALLTY